MFNRLADVQQMERRKNMEVYSKELATDADKRVREQQYNQEQEKQYEFTLAMNKKKEADMLNHQTMQTKKSMQNLLAQDYENAMRLRNIQKQDEKRQGLMAGQVSVQKAQIELDYLRKAEDEKKRMIREILTNVFIICSLIL
jgi:CHAT domain-containing protein